MLLKTDKLLYDLLDGVLLYQEAHTASVMEDFNETAADTAPNVVRFGSQEYQSQLDNVTRPWISIQLLNTPTESSLRHPHSKRLWSHLSGDTTQAYTAPYPKPVDVEYQLDVRSPDEIWLREIEMEIQRRFAFNDAGMYDTTLMGQPLGATIGDLPIPIRLFFDGPTRIRNLPQNERLFRATWTLEVHTWLLSTRAAIDLVKTYQTGIVDVEILNRDDTVNDTDQWNIT